VPAGTALPASTVSFDATIEITKSGVSRALRTHVDRIRGAGNAWRTTFTLADDPRLSAMTAPGWRINRLVIDEAGHLSIYDANGSPVRLPIPNAHPVTVKGTTVTPPAPSPATIAGMVIHTGWIDEAIMSGPARSQELAAAIGRAVSLGRDSQGLDHYRSTHGGRVSDLAVDPVAGVVTAINVSQQGAQLYSITHQAVAGPAGISILEKTQTQASSDKGTRTHGVTLTNIVIDGQGVKL